MSKFEKWNLSKSTFAYWRISMCKICMLRFHHMQKEDSHPSSFRQVYLFPILRNSPSHLQLTPEAQAKMMKIKDCLHCGHCMSKCPYGLNTPELLQRNLKDYEEVLAGKEIFWEAGTFSRRCWSRSRPDMAYSSRRHGRSFRITVFCHSRSGCGSRRPSPADCRYSLKIRQAHVPSGHPRSEVRCRTAPETRKRLLNCWSDLRTMPSWQ